MQTCLKFIQKIRSVHNKSYKMTQNNVNVLVKWKKKKKKKQSKHQIFAYLHISVLFMRKSSQLLYSRRLKANGIELTFTVFITSMLIFYTSPFIPTSRFISIWRTWNLVAILLINTTTQKKICATCARANNNKRKTSL